MWIRIGQLTAIVLAVSLTFVGDGLSTTWTARDAARYTRDMLRDFPWTSDPYRFDTEAPREGLDSAAVTALYESLVPRDTKALLIVRNGRIVGEWYGKFHGSAVRYPTASLAKALVGGTALLLAKDNGRIDLDDPAWRYIPAWRDDSLRSLITIRDLANHSSGIQDARWTEGSRASAASWKERYRREHSARFQIALHEAPILFRPGTQTAYSNPGYAALSYALAASLSDTPVADLEEFLSTRIMRPLGIPDHHWSMGYGRRFRQDGLTLQLADGGGRYTARAIARVGQLIAERGIWNEQQLLNPALVDSLIRGELGTPGVRPEGEPIPAIGWWSNAQRIWPHLPEDTLVGAGAGHQVVVVVPSRRTVLVRQGGSLGGPHSGPGYWQALDRHLLSPAAQIFDPPSNNG